MSFKVSIILPVYNVEKYLETCLDSLIAQTLENIEIVAVNDGSTDGSLHILEQYQQRYPQKVFVYSTKNHGVSHARNYGFSHSHGEYVWFVDSDDYIEPDACRCLYGKAINDHNDLVLFRYYNVDDATGERKEYIKACHNQNFTVAEKPYELPTISPYPWIKFIRRDLFEGLHFPEGIRFEDLPVAYLLGVKAHSIGYVNRCFYNYRKNVGFLGALTPSTLQIKDAIIFMKEEMQRLGYYDQYKTELDFIAVRHFLYRFWKLLTNYEKAKKDLKIQLVNELFDYLEEEIPNWQDNHYVKYSLAPHIARMMYLYGSRKEMLRFVKTCGKKRPRFQKDWLKEYKAEHAPIRKYRPAAQLEKDNAAAQIYHLAYTGSIAPDPEQIFLEAGRGTKIPTWLLKLILHLEQNHSDHHIVLSLQKKSKPLLMALLNRYLPGKKNTLPSNITLVQPHTEAYGKALALSGYVITDGPLPWYFCKEEGQFFLLYCGHTLYPKTILNTQVSVPDTGLWQHSMFMADCLYFSNEKNRSIYMKECMLEGICPTPSVVGNFNEMTMTPELSLREKLRSSLQMDKKQTILYAPLLPGENYTDVMQTYRNFMSTLYEFDQELDNRQIVYLHLENIKETDLSVFRHIKAMPRDIDISDFANACDVFISDYHTALTANFPSGTKKIQFLSGEYLPVLDENADFIKSNVSSEENAHSNENTSCKAAGNLYVKYNNIPQIMEYLDEVRRTQDDLTKDATAPGIQTWDSSESQYSAEHISAAKTFAENISAADSPEIKAQKRQNKSSKNPRQALTDNENYPLTNVLDSLLSGRPLPYLESVSHSDRTHILYYTGRELSLNLIQDFNTMAAQSPDKQFWLAYNDFNNSDYLQCLGKLSPECFFLPLKPDQTKNKQWLFADTFTEKRIFSSIYPLSHVLKLGKEEYQKCLNKVQFDEVVITSTDNLKTIATLLAAAPSASYTFDTFSPEQYATSPTYRQRFGFLCRLMKSIGTTGVPEKLTELKRPIKLSVIIPVHNAEKYLNETLDSVLGQDIKDLEVICVDDASTDGSVALIKERQKKDSRIILLQNEENQFAGYCRNRGLEIAQGEYVHFLDADDIVEQGAYQKYYDLAKAADADLIKGCASCFDNETGEISDTPLFALSNVPENAFDKVLTFSQKPDVFSHISVVPWNGIYKRSFLMEKELRFNHLVCVNDRSFYSEAVFAASRIWLTHDKIVRYRINNGASLVGNRARNFHCEFDSYAMIMEQCKKYNIKDRQLAVVMERELIDIFIWYRKYKKVPEVSEEIISQTAAFSRSLDITPLEEYPPAFKWYYDYLTFLPEFETLTQNYNNIADFKKRAKKLMPKCKNMEDFKAQMMVMPESTNITATAAKKQPE